jgi:hypothetical protein
VRRLFIFIVIVTACSGPAKPDSAAPPKRRVITQMAGAPDPLPFTSKCVKPDDPAIAELQRRADAATKTSFDAELARNHLHVLALAAHEDQLGEGIQQGPMLGDGKPRAAEGSAVHKKLADVEGTFVAAETHWTGNPGTPSAWEFVQDDQGNMFRLIRKHRAAITQVFLCTCREQQCGPYGSGCPACGSTNQIMYGPLPAGTKYGGELELSYQANVVSIEHNEQGCPAPRDCGPPPP